MIQKQKVYLNKTGFTLVELLAVIVILGIIITFATTNSFGIFNKSKSGIDKVQQNKIKDAAKMYYEDCLYGNLTDSGNDECSEFSEKIDSEGLFSTPTCVTLKKLYDLDYIDEIKKDESTYYAGIYIKPNNKDDNYKSPEITIDKDNKTCKFRT